MFSGEKCGEDFPRILGVRLWNWCRSVGVEFCHQQGDPFCVNLVCAAAVCWRKSQCLERNNLAVAIGFASGWRTSVRGT